MIKLPLNKSELQVMIRFANDISLRLGAKRDIQMVCDYDLMQSILLKLSLKKIRAEMNASEPKKITLKTWEALVLCRYRNINDNYGYYEKTITDEIMNFICQKLADYSPTPSQ